MSDAIAFLGLIPLIGVFTLAVGIGVCLIFPETKNPKRYGKPFFVEPPKPPERSTESEYLEDMDLSIKTGELT